MYKQSDKHEIIIFLLHESGLSAIARSQLKNHFGQSSFNLRYILTLFYTHDD